MLLNYMSICRSCVCPPHPPLGVFAFLCEVEGCIDTQNGIGRTTFQQESDSTGVIIAIVGIQCAERIDPNMFTILYGMER